MDDRQAKAAIALLSAYYPNQPMPDSTVIAWTMQLRTYEYEDARWAIEQIVQTSRRMPSLADVLDGVRSHRRDQPERALPAPQPSRLADRIEQHLSPCDDELAYLDARSDQHMRDQAVAAFREKRFKLQLIAGGEWHRVADELDSAALPLNVIGEVWRRDAAASVRGSRV